MTVRWVGELDDADRDAVGEKAVSLGRLQSAGLKVPRGFVVGADTFRTFLQQNALEEDINRVLAQTDRGDREQVETAANRIRSMIMDGAVDGEVRDAIETAYSRINMTEEVRNAGEEAVSLVGGQRETEFVAVRPSTTGTRIPGVHHVAVNVNGKDSLITQIKQCWASRFSLEALQLEEALGEVGDMAVLVQRMVDADVSGAVFNTHPVDGEARGSARASDSTRPEGSVQENVYLIEATWGLGTALSDGSGGADSYRVDGDGSLIGEEVAHKGWKMVRDPNSGKTQKQRVAGSERDVRCLEPDQREEVVQMMQKVEDRFGGTVQLAFTFERNHLTVLDASPVTRAGEGGDAEGEAVLRGRGGGGSTTSGPVTLLYKDADIETVEDGGVVVTVDASARYAPLLQKANGVITDNGGIASNLAAIARSLDVPCVVGTGNATDMLTRGEVVTVNGQTGSVLEGEISPSEETPDTGTGGVVTATRIAIRGRQQHEEADTAIIDDYLDPGTARDLTAFYAPERVWGRSRGGTPDGMGRLVEEHNINGEGVVLRTYGRVMRCKDFVQDGASFIGLDATALREDGGAEALRNAVEMVGETADGVESALLLDAVDTDLIEAAVEHGIDTIAVPPAAVDRASHIVARAEKRVILDALRRL